MKSRNRTSGIGHFAGRRPVANSKLTDFTMVDFKMSLMALDSACVNVAPCRPEFGKMTFHRRSGLRSASADHIFSR